MQGTLWSWLADARKSSAGAKSTPDLMLDGSAPELGHPIREINESRAGQSRSARVAAAVDAVLGPLPPRLVDPHVQWEVPSRDERLAAARERSKWVSLHRTDSWSDILPSDDESVLSDDSWSDDGLRSGLSDDGSMSTFGTPRSSRRRGRRRRSSSASSGGYGTARCRERKGLRAGGGGGGQVSSLEFSSEADDGGGPRVDMSFGGSGELVRTRSGTGPQGGLDRMYEMLETARESKQATLHVPIIGLTRVPERIARLTELEELRINSNMMTTLPASIGRLARLRVLELRQNHLTSLPREIGDLKALVSLDVSWNKLEVLPGTIGKCSRLKVLVVSHNKLVQLPQEIGFLLGLEVLAADDNELTSLPPSFGYLQHLRTFSVSENSLRSLIPQIGLLTQCESYDISRNPTVASLSMPLWFLGEPIPQKTAWLLDGVFVTFAFVLFLTGGLGGRERARSGLAVAQLALTGVPITLLFISVIVASLRVAMPSFTPAPRLRASMTNALALFTLVWEFMQLVAMSIPGVRWPGVVGTTVKVFLLDIGALFAPLFWCSVVLGCALRAALEFPRLQSFMHSVGLNITLNLSSYLAFASALFYLPILHNALGALACSYLEAESKARDALVLHRNPDVECWSGAHFVFALGAIGVLLIYYPMAVLSNPIWQERNMRLDVRFHPDYLLVVSQAKMFFSVVTNFTRESTTRLSILLVSFLAMTLYTLYSRPSSSVLDIWRGLSFLGASGMAGLGLWVTHDDSVSMSVVVGILAAWWVVLGALGTSATLWVWHVHTRSMKAQLSMTGSFFGPPTSPGLSPGGGGGLGLSLGPLSPLGDVENTSPCLAADSDSSGSSSSSSLRGGKTSAEQSSPTVCRVARPSAALDDTSSGSDGVLGMTMVCRSSRSGSKSV
ncbi:leucine-rich repeat containing protein [Thecamonas trahens ATCC 50062]|uniref:Leucine-rich repeat containing protein n=1 Tax=Thecamonas trahens ATCC 50062 TaxID=461836 RepID=A0A0L0DKM3_THETB|nr:leucine-rich repeat containing protein [Thecamonas trahens ATCC 50062]KNC52924.1 leucine-rich repeat containing protein [Thecamonas trahens ATCC 50062]|eukprot:XP_013754820.1 leucine-rich repeat containing protein [Thecamonas trahens ATCC 50062]